MIRPSALSTLSLALITVSLPASAQQKEEDELAAIYGDKSTVSIATGNQQNTTQAPSSATVITAREIQAMGATDLTQVLETVPGLHVSVAAEGYFPKYIFRGITSEFGPEVLILLNGYRTNTNFLGIPTLVTGQTPVANISRIEVIRGPGSALYGADAFSGVINIITKTASEINGTELNFGLTNFKGRDAWLQYGGKWNTLDTAIFIQAGRNDGPVKPIQNNLTTRPISINAASQHIDARIDLHYENWRVRLGYQDRTTGSGPDSSLLNDTTTRLPEQRLNADLIYQKNGLLPAFDLTVTANLFQLKQSGINPGFSNVVIGNPGHSERNTTLAISGLYSAVAKHRIRAGWGHQLENLYKTENPVPTNHNANLVFLSPRQRWLNYGFIQDEWNFANDWNLTAGIRHDRYSDFGSTTNPRLALVWDAAYNLTMKALHGHAFRAPSFVEQYSTSLPGNTSSTPLQPARIKTTELAVVWQMLPTLQTNFTLFQYKEKDIIQFIHSPGAPLPIARNSGNQTGRGFELETTWDAQRNLRLSGNYSFQRSSDETSGQDAGLAPHHHLFLRADWRIAQLWNLVGNINHVGARARQANDSHMASVPGFVTADINLRSEKLWSHWELQASVKNLFNRDAREPSAASSNIGYDLPLAKRTLYLQLGYKF